MKFILTNHDELTEKQLYNIANIKSQHWVYPIDSQIDWIQNVYKKSDTHIFLMDNDVLIGYVAIAEISIVADEKNLNVFGISCLCVDKRYLNKGYGSLIMERALRFAKDNEKSICLLCKEKLVRFYERCGYVAINPKNIFVEQSNYNYKLMIYDGIENNEIETLIRAQNISIDRNF